MKKKSLKTYILLVVVFFCFLGTKASSITNGSGNTYVPDDNFEQALIDLGLDSGPLNDSIPTANISSLTDLRLYQKNIFDLSGIEDFISLQELEVDDNNLTNLNVSTLTQLKELSFDNNDLTTIDVSLLTQLELLSGWKNQLTSLDVTNNTLLNTLYIWDNNLTSIDLSKNTALVALLCDNNQLTALDVSANTLLEGLTCSNNNFSGIDITNNLALDLLYAQGLNITSLDLSQHTLLRVLYVNDNSLTTLDLSNNPLLTHIHVENNQLTDLNVNNGAIANMNTFNFDTTNNPNLTCISVDDVAWSIANLTAIDAQTSFSENCALEGYTLIPDVNFEQALINDGFDSEVDGKVLTANIDSITGLFIDNEGITDLTGIEDFISVTYLSCQGNPLETYDFSTMPQLEQLWIADSNLTSLDLSGLVSLEQLRCKGNNITNFDTTGAPNLLGLYIQDNGLTSLNIQNSPLLTILEVYDNQLTSLDVSANIMLTDIYLRANLLTTIDLSTNVNLNFLGGSDNLFTSLDFSNNPNFDLLQASGNNLTSLNLKNGNNTNLSISISNNPNLTCVAVDDVAYSDANWTTKDVQTSYATDCTPGIKVYAKKEGVSNAPRIHIWPNEVESVTSNWPNNLQFMSPSVTYPDYYEYEVKNGQTVVNTLFIFDGVQTLDQMNLTQDTWFTVASNGTVSSTVTAPVPATTPVLTVSTDASFDEGTTQTITASATLGAEIRYTFSNGGVPTDPTISSTLYTGALSVTETSTYKFIAFSGSDTSVVETVTYTFNPASTGIKIYAKKEGVTSAPQIHAWPNITDWNSKPTMTASTNDFFVYEVPNDRTTVNALFIFDGVQTPDQTNITQDTWFTVAANGTVTSTTTAPVVETIPVLTVSPSAAFDADTTQSITASSTLGATIYYTTSTDGATPADPTASSTLYTGSIDITATTKFKFIAYNGVHVSTIESREYTFPVIPVLTVSPDATYDEGTTQTITASATLGAPIYYTFTTDGSDPGTPTTNSTLYTGALTVTGSVRYNFRAFNGANASFMQTTVYTFAPPATGIKIYAQKVGTTNAPQIHAWPNITSWNSKPTMTASTTYSEYFIYEVPEDRTTVNVLFIFDGVQTPDQTNITQDTWFTIAANGTVTSTTTAPAPPTTPIVTVSEGGTFDIGTTELVTASATLNAEIRFTSSVSGTPADPTPASPIYTGPISLSESAIYKFRAFNGVHASEVETVSYIFVAPNSGIKIYAKKEGGVNAPRIHVWPNEIESVTSNWPNNLQFMTASTTYSDYFEYEVKNGQALVNTLFLFDGVQTSDQNTITQDTWFTIASNGTVTRSTTPPSASRSIFSVAQVVEGLVVAPSPARNFIEVKYPLSDNQSSGVIEIYNLQGKRVAIKSFTSPLDLEEKIDVSSLANGIHILTIQVGAQHEVVKFSITR